MFDSAITGIVLSCLLGGLLGVQREIRQQKTKTQDFAGFRTYTLISLFGFLVGFLSFDVLGSFYVLPVTFGGVFLLLVISYYGVSSYDKKQIGIMSQIIALLAFVMGILVSLKYYQLSIMISIITTTILFFGTQLHHFVKNLTQAEIYASLKFAIISLIILPLLPNKNYTLLDLPVFGTFFEKQTLFNLSVLNQIDVFNFYYLWLMVVFISGIAFIGYALMKTIGAQKGILVTGFLGGLMSSTALTSSFSIESRSFKKLSWPLAIGVAIASSVMFFRVLFVVAVLNPNLFLGLLFSLGLMGVCGVLLAVHLYFKKGKESQKINNFELDSPFTIIPALKFALLFLVVMFVTKLLTVIFGNSGIYIISFISGITDVDAITISLSKLAFEGSISNLSAQFGVIIAAFANTFFKGGIAYFLGSKEFFRVVMLVFGFILFIGGFSLIV